jgi:hypothetical protein
MKRIFIALAFLMAIVLLFAIYHYKSDKTIIRCALQKQKEFHNSSGYILYIDLEKPVFLPRLYFIDKKQNKIIKQSFVFTSYKSGLIYTTKFSNTPHSNLSSYGAFEVLNDYYGAYGYSARLKGLEKHNNNVLIRAVVLHPWKFKPYTLGCYSTFEKNLKEILPLLKNGGFMYVNISASDSCYKQKNASGL